MSMPFRQKRKYCCCPCACRDMREVKQADGTYKTIVENEELPPSKNYETAAMVAAGVPMEKVSSYFTNIVNPPKEDEE